MMFIKFKTGILKIINNVEQRHLNDLTALNQQVKKHDDLKAEIKTLRGVLK